MFLQELSKAQQAPFGSRLWSTVKDTVKHGNQLTSIASQTNPSVQKLTPTHTLKPKSAALKAAQVEYKKSQKVEKTPQKNIISNKLILESKQTSNEPWKKGVEKVQKLKFAEPKQQKVGVKHTAHLLNKLKNQGQGIPESARPQNPIYMTKDAPLLRFRRSIGKEVQKEGTQNMGKR